MAPRRKRGGETRMHAALDAMSLLGFPRPVIRRTVDQLLKVYGGNEGWVFIEDSAYSVLIEKLLELPQAKDGLIEDKPGDSSAEASSAGCSNRALVPCSITHTSDNAPLNNQATDTISASSETGNGLAIMDVDTVSATIGTGNQVPIEATGIVSANNEIDCTPAPSPLTKSSQPVGKLCRKKRKPCYGWISDDSYDEEDLLKLPPAPMSEVLVYMQANDGVN